MILLHTPIHIVYRALPLEHHGVHIARSAGSVEDVLVQVADIWHYDPRSMMYLYVLSKIRKMSI
jgi:hypothetical protein